MLPNPPCETGSPVNRFEKSENGKRPGGGLVKRFVVFFTFFTIFTCVIGNILSEIEQSKRPGASHGDEIIGIIRE